MEFKSVTSRPTNIKSARHFQIRLTAEYEYSEVDSGEVSISFSGSVAALCCAAPRREPSSGSAGSSCSGFTT